MSRAERIKELADAMYEAAQYLSTDASRLRKTMEDYHRYIVYEYSGEKNLVLTWEDIQLICEIEEKLWNEEFQQVLDGKVYVQNHYKEVLRRFNEQRKK